MTGGMAFWRAVGEALMDGRDVVELDVVADALRMGGPHPMADALRAAAPDLIAQDWADFLEAVARVGDCNVNLLRHHGRAALDELLGLVAEALARSSRGMTGPKEVAHHARTDH